MTERLGVHVQNELRDEDGTAYGRLIKLLPAIGRAIGDRPFGSRELILFARSPLPHADELRCVLEAVLGNIDDAGAGHRLSRLLARADRRPVEGYCVRVVGADGSGAIWRSTAS